MTRTRFSLVLASTLFIVCAPAHAITKEVVDRVKHAVAYIEVSDGSGTAFQIDPAGYFITNEHVVEDARTVQLVLNSGEANQETVTGHVVRVDKDLDFALIKSDKPASETLSFGQDADLYETLPITAFGFPLGKDILLGADGSPTVSINTGHVSALRQDKGGIEMIQIDADVNPGNSGGPVLDDQGHVLGVVEAGIEGASGLNFAIPIGILKSFLYKPDVSFFPSSIPASEESDVTKFTVDVTSFNAAFKPRSVDVTFQSPSLPERTYTATQDSGSRYTFSAQLIPKSEGPKQLKLDIRNKDGGLSAVTTDIPIDIGGRTYKLSDFNEISPSGSAPNKLGAGGSVVGRVTGLPTVKVTISGIKADLDLSNVNSIYIAPLDQPIDSVHYKIRVTSDSTEPVVSEGDVSVGNTGTLYHGPLPEVVAGITPTQVTFGPPTKFTVPGIGRPRVIDLDGDGHLDIVAQTTAGFTVFYGDGNGSFTEVDYPIQLGSPVVFADFKRDGHMDIASSYTTSVGIIYNRGHREFSQPVTVVTGPKIYGLCAGDFNEDGRPDLATGDNSTGQVGIVLNEGHGTFAAPVYYTLHGPFTMGAYITEVKAAKLTDSGHLDLVVGVAYNSGAPILYGDGEGEFKERGTAPTGGGEIVSTDIAGRGYADLAGCDYWGGSLGISLNDGSGVFKQGQRINGLQYPSGIFAADLNGDGYIDLAVGHAGSSGFSVFLNDGTGNMIDQGVVTTEGATDVHNPAIGDFDEDGLPDIVVDGENDSLVVYENTTDVLPAIGTLDPNSASSGGESLRLNVYGSGFLKRSVIDWNGKPLKTTFVSNTLVTADVPAALLRTHGQIPVKVATPLPGGGSSGPLLFTVK